MPKTYNEVRDIGQLDPASPFAADVKYAKMPNEDSGLVIKELVTGLDDTHPAVVWNADGSVTGGSGSHGFNDIDSVDRTGDDIDVINDGFVLVVDGYFPNNNSNRVFSLLRTYPVAGWSNGQFVLEYNVWGKPAFSIANSTGTSASHRLTSDLNGTLVVHHKAAGETDIYQHGSLVHTLPTVSGSGRSITSFKNAIGSPTSKLKMMALYHRSGLDFTAQEVTDIIADPYGIFSASGGEPPPPSGGFNACVARSNNYILGGL